MMTETAKALRREYKNAWSRKNPDKIRRYTENYWNRKAEAAEAAAQAQVADEPKQQEA